MQIINYVKFQHYWVQETLASFHIKYIDVNVVIIEMILISTPRKNNRAPNMRKNATSSAKPSVSGCQTTYGSLIASEKFEPAGFAAPLGHKDIRLALSAAEALTVPLPLASLLHDRFLRLLANGGEGLDWSAIGGLAARDAGLS